MPFYWYRENKTCPHCGERFAPRCREQYCSPTCKQQAQTKRRRVRRVEQRKRDLDQATCRVCGTPLTDAQSPLAPLLQQQMSADSLPGA